MLLLKKKEKIIAEIMSLVQKFKSQVFLLAMSSKSSNGFYLFTQEVYTVEISKKDLLKTTGDLGFMLCMSLEYFLV